MSIELTRADASTRQALYETLLTSWNQQWGAEFQEEFLDWRYGRRPDGETLIAMSGSKCVGVLDNFIRPYRIGGREVLVREPCEWYCLPGNRKGTLALALGMKWTHLADTCEFVLPITARRLAGTILRRARLGDGSITRYLPRRIRLQPLSVWTKHREVEGEVDDLSLDDLAGKGWPSADDKVAHSIAPVLTKSYVHWLRACPASLGAAFCCAFRIKGALAGITVCRIEASKVGRKAKLIHLQSSELNVRTLRWMIAENVRRAIQLDAEKFQCRSSCAVTNAALLSLRFRPAANVPVIAGFNDLPIPAGAANVTYLRGDDAMIPTLIGE